MQAPLDFERIPGSDKDRGFESPPAAPTGAGALVSVGEGNSLSPPPKGGPGKRYALKGGYGKRYVKKPCAYCGSPDHQRPECPKHAFNAGQVAELKEQIAQVPVADPLEARKSVDKYVPDFVTPESKENRRWNALKGLVRDLPAKLGHMAEDGYSRALMAYLSTLGDPVQTGRLTGVETEQIRLWAEADGWNAKITDLLTVKKEKGVAAFAIELNRLMNLTQAVRCRGLLDEVLTRIMTNEEDLADWLSNKTQHATNTTAKPLLELARAILAVQQATYMALGDQAPERAAAAKLEEKEDEDKPQEPHLALFSTLAQLTARNPIPVLRGVELPPVRPTPPEI